MNGTFVSATGGTFESDTGGTFNPPLSGLDYLIINFCTENTKIILPLGLNGKLYDMINYNRDDQYIVDLIAGLNHISKSVHLTSAVAPFLSQYMERFILSDYPADIPVSIETLSPLSPLINDRIAQGKIIHKNELSIVIHLRVGKYNFLFCSDVENETIVQMNDDSFQKPDFIKIPHHASQTSSELLNISTLDRDSTSACTTVYKIHNLPNPEVIDSYKALCKTVCCTDVKDDDDVDYGVIEYSYNLFEKEPSLKISFSGNASYL